MCLFKYLKIVSLLIVLNSCSCGKQTTDEKFKKLETCLTSAGVAVENIIYRDDRNKNTSEYNELNWQWNSLNGYLQPMAYLLATNVSDVQSAVICCKSLKIRIVPKGGGHSYVKNSYGDSESMVVDLSRLNEISLDPIRMNCAVGAGARMGFIISTLWKFNFLIPVGICPTVGITGLALGGGWGYFTRLYGLTSDNLIELEMVDAKGRLLLINKSTHNDLFYALRGGGGGSYGIVTKLKFKMYSAPPTIVYGVYEYSFSDFSRFYEAWQYLIQTTEFETYNLGTIVVISKNFIKMEIFYINMEKQITEADMINYVSRFTFPSTTKRSVKKLSYSQFLLNISQEYSNNKVLKHPSELGNITKHNKLGWKKVKSFYMDAILDRNEINEIYLLLGAYLKFGSVALLQNGGAMNNFSRSETAFVHRYNLYDVHMWAFSPKNENSKAHYAMTSAMKTFYEASKDIFNHRESYQNYLDQDIPDYLDRYYKENLKKLIEIKIKYDVENVFHHRQSIPANFRFHFIDEPILVL